MDEIVLKIDNLQVSFEREGEVRQAIKGVSLEVRRGETLGLVGESGSGKSVTSLAIMGLLPRNATCNMASAPCRKAMVFQEPMTSLNPVQRCGAQVEEMLLAHEHVSRQEARRRTLELFEEVLLPRPEKIYASYPHEISGGQKQRVMIAMALIANPDLLIADEPTTALDVTVQRAILDLLRSLQRKYRMGIIFITHDLGVVAQVADRVAVMYHGEIVEQGDAQEVLHHPRHPYTQGLLACRPPLDSRPSRLMTVKDFMEGAAQGTLPVENEGKCAEANSAGAMQGVQGEQQTGTEGDHKEVLLRVRDLDVTYALETNLLGKATKELKAVDGFSFDLYRGETLGLVGESGCGKSTLGRTLLRLMEKRAGTIEYDGVSIDAMSRQQLKDLRRKMQIVFQDPYASLNPRFTIGEAIMEPLRCHHLYNNERERRQQVLAMMQQVGLEEGMYDRYPHEFSGGQRQRVCIARALILQPELVICDESVSALDVSVQAQVLNLLNDLKRQFGYTYLFITHDLSVVKFLSDRIMVMEKGRLVELAPSDELFAHPKQQYTQRLLDALPRV